MGRCDSLFRQDHVERCSRVDGLQGDPVFYQTGVRGVAKSHLCPLLGLSPGEIRKSSNGKGGDKALARLNIPKRDDSQVAAATRAQPASLLTARTKRTNIEHNRTSRHFPSALARSRKDHLCYVIQPFRHPCRTQRPYRSDRQRRAARPHHPSVPHSRDRWPPPEGWAGRWRPA